MLNTITIPVPIHVYLQAIDYVVNSLPHTYIYITQNDGKQQRVQNILVGQLAQLSLFEYLKINGYDVEQDNTSFWQHDKYDFKFNGFVIDVKATTTKWPLQITSEKSRDGVDHFCHCHVDPSFKFVTVFGFISASVAMDNKYLIKRGEKIPLGNGATQKFSESWFYTGKFHSIDKYNKKSKEEIEKLKQII